MNKLIKTFFNSQDNDIDRYPYQLASDYLRYCFDNPEVYSDSINTTIYSFADDFLLNSSVTRGLMFTPNIAILQQAKTPFMFNQKIYSNQEVHRQYVYSSSLEILGKWLIEVKDLLINGLVTYIPNGYRDIETDPKSRMVVIGRKLHKDEFGMYSKEISDIFSDYKYIQTVSDKPPNSNTVREYITPSTINDISSLQVLKMLESANITILNSDVALNKDLITRLFTVKIPTLDAVPLHRFASVLLEKPQIFNSFSNFMKQEVLNIDTLNQNKIDKLALDIQAQSKELKFSIENSLSNYLFNSGIVALSTISANLFVVNLELLDLLQAVLGGATTGFAAELKVLQSYINQRKQNQKNPLYFLWILDKHSSR